MMPIKNGLELSKILKADEKTSHIPIVILTAKASEESKLEGLEAGADNYLTKPFNPKELKIRVKNILKLQEKIREQIKSELFVVPKGKGIKSKEKLFVDKVLEVIDKNMRETNFGVEDLASKMFMSKSQLYRKIKALTDYTPVQLILNYRLKKAAELIEQNYGSITEIAYEVGFNNLGYFSQTFKKTFGVSPNLYKQDNKAK
jgi:YesN/AraC family two-component response regulator